MGWSVAGSWSEYVESLKYSNRQISKLASLESMIYIYIYIAQPRSVACEYATTPFIVSLPFLEVTYYYSGNSLGEVAYRSRP